MKRTATLIILALLSSTTLFAQQRIRTKQWTETAEGTDELGHYITETTFEKGVVMASGRWKNWVASAYIGTQFYLGDNDWKFGFKDIWTGPSFDVYLNKWISPNFGLGIGYTCSPFKGLYQVRYDTPAFRTDEYYGEYKSQILNLQSGYMFNPYVIALVDIDNLLAGYDPNRLMNIAMYAGGGLILGTDPIQTRCGATYNMGFWNVFRLGRKIDLSLNVRGSLVSDNFDGESRTTEPQTVQYIRRNIPFDMTFGVSGGLLYHIGTVEKTKEWQNVSSVTKTYTGYAEAKAEIERLQQELAQSKEEYERIIEEKNKIIEIKDPAHLWYHVQFKIDKWDIQNRELVNLKYVADFIKNAPNTKFSICGYADKQTATPKHNLMLSQNRVKQVFKVLTEEFGVNPEQLISDYKGGVDLMFYSDNVLSRCVIIKSAED